jgi:ankyrin repeat protein
LNSSYYGHTKVVQLLLNNGAQANRKTNRGDTALSIAKKKGKDDIVKVLKKYGAKE